MNERRAHELLGKLLTIAAADRPSWLAREVPDDPELRARLLAAIPTKSIDGASADAAEPLRFLRPDPSPEEDPIVGERLGAFVVEARLTEQGGMGTVYRGRRADGTFAQDVAIKIIPRGRDTDGVLRRFTLERRVLGLLQHPNIVRILDAGAVADGRPYFVMEWVHGVPLDRFSTGQEPSLAERLALFRQLCAAVQYAHQRFVVHRDLKPGNVLVTPDGAPKILDFGLAKLLDEDDPGAGLLSRTNERPMTPAYASPEQVRGGPVTTATDVHALGLILYELLTGHRPYRLTSSSASEIERVICREDPELPSRAARRESGPAPVPAHRLRGELDAIVMRALQKQPDDRYQTAAELGEDIARYLSGRPVLAKRSSAAYRAGKFVRRHVKGLTAAAAVLLVAAAFVVQNTLHARGLGVERDRAQASLRFLVSLFTASAPDNAKGEKLTAADLLDRGAKRLETELRHQPATRATLLFTIGDVYDRIGRYDAAERLLAESIDLQRQLSSRPTLELAEALSALGRVPGTKQDASRLYHEALAIRRRLLPPGDPLIARSLNNIASLKHSAGDYAGAAAGYREAADGFPAGHEGDRAISLINLSASLFQLNRFAESAAAAREAWQITQAIHGPDHSATISALGALGWALFGLGEQTEAERIRRDVVERSRRLWGDTHFRVAEAWYTLGTMLSGLNRPDDAERALREAEAIWRRLPGILEDRVAWTLSGLGNILGQKGKFAEAEAYLRESLELRTKAKGDRHVDVGESLGSLGGLAYRRGRLAEAEKYFRMNLDLLRSIPGLPRSEQAYPETDLGRLFTEQGRLDEAEPLLRHAVEGLRQDLPPGHARIAFAEVLLGDWLRRAGRFDEAKPLIEGGVSILRSKEPGTERTRDAEARLVALADAVSKARVK
jgi:serine/threonine-protein kinase